MKRNYIAPLTEIQFLNIGLYMQTLSSQTINYGGGTVRFDSKAFIFEDDNPFEVEDVVLLNGQSIRFDE